MVYFNYVFSSWASFSLSVHTSWYKYIGIWHFLFWKHKTTLRKGAQNSGLVASHHHIARHLVFPAATPCAS